MAKPDVKTETNKDEFSRIFDEYRAKIEEISRKSVRNPPQAGARSNAAARGAAGDLEVTVARVQPKSGGSAKEDSSAYEREAQEIIMAARRQAQEIIDEAEERSRREASKRTQSQVEKIIGRARNEAEEMIALARKATEKESGEIAAAAKQEAERLLREITETCRRETQVQSNRTIEEARGKADKMMSEIVQTCREISGMVTDIVSRTRKTIDEFEAKLQSDVSELAKAIADTQRRLEEVTVHALSEKEEIKPAAAAGSRKPEIIESPTLAVKILGAKSNGQHGTQPLFSGQVEMKSISASFDYQYLKSLKKYLVHIPNIRYVQEYASEKEISVLFELKEPLPLLEIIRNIPQVSEIITDADNISIVFKNNP